MKGPSTFYFLYAWFSIKKNLDMLALMLDPKYKSMCLVTTYLGCEVVAILVANYDKQLLLPLLLEAYKGLLPSRGDYLDEFASLVDSQDLFE